MSNKKQTKTGGREATEGVIPGRFALSVGKPESPTPDGWQWTRLTDVARLETGHTPSRKKSEYWGGDIPWIGIKDATSNHGFVIEDTLQHVTQEGIDNSSARILPANTVCLSRTASVGYMVVMGKPMATSQDFINWVCTEKIDYRYLAAILYAEHASYSLFSRGTTHQTIYFPEAKAFHVLLPSRERQKEIADAVWSLTNKISLNTQTNKTLESIAQAIFKSWFVDFEPVKAKMAATERWYAMQPTSEPASPVCYADETALPDLETYTNLAAMCAISGKNETELAQLQQQNPDHYQQLAETAALFPSAMVDSELGEVPEGWKLRPLYDTAEYINGGAFKTEHFSQDQSGLPIIKIAELKQGITASTKFTHKDFNKKISVDNGDILYSWSGSPETSLEVFKWFGGKGWLNQHIFKLSFESEDDKVFTFYLLKFLKPLLIETAKQKQTTGLGHITVADMKRIQTVSPSPTVLREFCYMVSPMFNKSSSLDIENMQLSQLRDSLLPKLLSGEIDLNEIQREVA